MDATYLNTLCSSYPKLNYDPKTTKQLALSDLTKQPFNTSVLLTLVYTCTILF